MNHKLVVRVAIVMVFVFGLIVVVYPQLFHPENSTAPVEPLPAEAPAGPIN